MNAEIEKIIRNTWAVIPGVRGLVESLREQGVEEDDVDLRIAAMQMWLTSLDLNLAPEHILSANELDGLIAAMRFITHKPQ